MKAGDRIAVSYLHPAETITPHFVRSLAAVRDSTPRLVTEFGLPAGANIVNARNAQVRWFLDHTQADWLWIIDSDMQFPPDTLERLAASADDRTQRIVGGLCFAVVTDPHTGQEYPAPTLYLAGGEDATMLRLWDWPEGLCEVDATGAACILIHRSVLEAMRAAHPAPWHWFRELAGDGKPVSEDITFCLRARSLGYSVWVDTSVLIDHMKLWPVNADMYGLFRHSPLFANVTGARPLSTVGGP